MCQIVSDQMKQPQPEEWNLYKELQEVQIELLKLTRIKSELFDILEAVLRIGKIETGDAQPEKEFINIMINL